MKPWRGKLFGKQQGRQISAGRQGIGSGKRPPKALVEVFGVIAAKGFRAVIKYAARVNQALFQGKGVDKRLECRAGRTPGPCAVNLALDFGGKKISRADQGANPHTVCIDQNGRCIANTNSSALFNVICNCPFQQFLQILFDKGTRNALIIQKVRPAQQLHGKVGRRKGQTRKRTHLERAGRSPFCHQRGQPDAGLVKILARYGISRNGILRHNGQGHAFKPGQFPCRFGKINPGRGFQSLDISPVGRKGEIGQQNFLLAVMAFQQKSMKNLPQLAAYACCFQLVTQTRHLHGNG